jgi:hypothetical protein
MSGRHVSEDSGDSLKNGSPACAPEKVRKSLKIVSQKSDSSLEANPSLLNTNQDRNHYPTTREILILSYMIFCVKSQIVAIMNIIRRQY